MQQKSYNVSTESPGILFKNVTPSEQNFIAENLNLKRRVTNMDHCEHNLTENHQKKLLKSRFCRALAPNFGQAMSLKKLGPDIHK